jgi:hypothetical protein
MASRGIYGSRVIEAHGVGDLYVHGFDEPEGYWASWDCASVIGIDSGKSLDEAWVRLAVFLEGAGREWHRFQRLNSLSTLIKVDDDEQGHLATFIKRARDHPSSGNVPDVYLGLGEQTQGLLGSFFKMLRPLNGAGGKIITPVVNLSNDYSWPEEDLPLFEAASSLSSPVFINKEHKIEYEIRNPWLDGGAPGVNTGVIGAITPNLPRAAHDVGDEETFFKRVEEQIDIAVEGLEAKRAHLELELKAGRLPFTASVVDSFDDFFGAVGVLGVHEALLNLLGKGIESMKGKAVTYKIIETMRDRLEDYERDTGHRFCLEAEPSGGAGHYLAELDKVRFPEMQTSGIEAPFYTSSTCLPVDYTDDLWDALEHQKKLQSMYTGGSIYNIFLDRGISDPSECKILVRRIFERAQVPCFAISPIVNLPTTTGVETYERIGYNYRAVSGMGAGEREEVRLRRPYAVVSGW